MAPLEKGTVSVLLGGQMDQSTDPKLLAADKIAYAKNCYYDKLGRVVKAPGFDASAYGIGFVASERSEAVNLLHADKDKLLICSKAYDSGTNEPRTDYSYQFFDCDISDTLPGITSPIIRDKGRCTPIKQSVNKFMQGDLTRKVEDADVAVLGDLEYAVWEDNGYIKLAVREIESGVLVSTNTVLSPVGGSKMYQPHPVALNTYVKIFARCDNDNIYAITVDNAGSTVGAQTLLVAVDPTVDGYDACTITNGATKYACIAYPLAVTHLIEVKYYNDVAGYSVFVTWTAPAVPAGYDMKTAITCQQVQLATTGAYMLAIVYDDQTDVLRYTLRTLAAPGTTLVAPTVIADLGADDYTLVRVTCSSEFVTVDSGYANDVFRVWAEVYFDDGAYEWPQVNSYRVRMDAAAALYQTDAQWYHYHLLSKAFMEYDVSYCWMSFESENDYQHFAVLGQYTGPYNGSMGVHGVAYLFDGRCLNRVKSGLCQVASYPTGEYVWAAALLEYADTGDSKRTDLDYRSVATATIDFSITNRNPASFDENTEIGGGKHYCYDGGLYEHGFIHAPEIMEATGIINGGVMFNGADYWYVCTYEFMDRHGLWHVSAPSEPLKVTTPALPGGSAASVSLVIKCCIPGDAVRNILAARIVIYRTVADGSLFTGILAMGSEYHYVGDCSNDYTAGGTIYGTTTYVDTASDFASAANRILYSTGGVLPNSNPPPGNIIVQHKDRLFCINEEMPKQIWFTKQKAAGVAAEWSGFLYIEMPEPVVAIESCGDMLVAFSYGRTFAVQGDGPDSLGGGSFFVPTEISLDEGCSNWKSVFRSDIGVIFQSTRGINVVAPNGGITRISEPIKDVLSTYSIVKCDTETGEKRIRMLLNDTNGTILIFDYNINRWSYWVRGTSALTDMAITPDNRVLYTRTNKIAFDYGFVADANLITMELETPWIHIGNLTNFQRIWWINVLGEYKSPHTLNVLVYHDYDVSAAKQTYSFAVATDPIKYLLRFKPKYQKCDSIKLRIYDSGSTTPYSSCTLSAVELTCGLKTHVNKRGRRP